MTIQTMYSPQKDSPSTVLQGDILASDPTFLVLNASILPQTTPFPLTLGFDTPSTETVMVTGINTSTNQLTVVRTDGRIWPAGTKIARVFNATDLSVVQDNIVDLQTQVNAIYPLGFAVNVTRTVGSGKQHATIQSAVDWFANKICFNCTIMVDPGTYLENVDITGYNAMIPGALSIIGDNRSLVGISYCHGILGNQAGTANGGSGTVTLSSSGNTITIAMSTTNPNFSAAGLVSGDSLFIRNSSGSTNDFTIASVSNNVITLMTAAPAINGNGASITIVPNTRIIGQSQRSAIEVYNPVKIKGFKVTGYNVSSSCIACSVGRVSFIINNVTTLSGGNGIFINSAYCETNQETTVFGPTTGFNVIIGGLLKANNSAAIHCTYGYIMQHNAQAVIQRSSAVGCSYGVFSQSSRIDFSSGAALGCTYGVFSDIQSYVEAYGAILRLCGTGLSASHMSLIAAASTNATNTSTIIASPATSGVEGNTSAIVLRS